MSLVPSLLELSTCAYFLLFWVAGIAVMIKLFKVEGVLKGLLGLICWLYPYLWGWSHYKDETLKIKTWMWVWTAGVLLGIILMTIGTLIN